MQIQDGIYRYCRAIDRLDFDGIRSAYHADAVDFHGSLFHGTVDEMLAWIKERHPWISFSMHSLSNIFIEFAGPDLAVVETYVRGLQRHRQGSPAIPGGRPTDVFTASRYVDRFERRAGEWRIAHRTLVSGWRRTLVVEGTEGSRVDPYMSRRDPEDFLFIERAAQGLPERY